MTPRSQKPTTSRKSLQNGLYTAGPLLATFCLLLGMQAIVNPTRNQGAGEIEQCKQALSCSGGNVQPKPFHPKLKASPPLPIGFGDNSHAQAPNNIDIPIDLVEGSRPLNLTAAARALDPHASASALTAVGDSEQQAQISGNALGQRQRSGQRPQKKQSQQWQNGQEKSQVQPKQGKAQLSPPRTGMGANGPTPGSSGDYISAINTDLEQSNDNGMQQSRQQALSSSAAGPVPVRPQQAAPVAATHLNQGEGQYDEARWRQFQEKLSFKLPRVPGTRAPTAADCCLSAGAEAVNRLAGYGPDALVVGTQKGGSTWLHAMLRKRAGYRGQRCDDVDLRGHRARGRGVKEVRFFDLLPLKQEWVDTYLAGFPPNGGGEAGLRMDDTPNYSRVSFAPCRLKKLLPDAKIIMLLREPADRDMSQWLMMYRASGTPGRSLTSVTCSNLARLQKGGCDFGLDHSPCAQQELLQQKWKQRWKENSRQKQRDQQQPPRQLYKASRLGEEGQQPHSDGKSLRSTSASQQHPESGRKSKGVEQQLTQEQQILHMQRQQKQYQQQRRLQLQQQYISGQGGHVRSGGPGTVLEGGQLPSWGQCFGCEWNVNRKFVDVGCMASVRVEEDDLATHVPVQAQYIARGMYAPMLAWWLDYFPPEQVLVLSSKALKDDPAGGVNTVMQFLGDQQRFQQRDFFDDEGQPLMSGQVHSEHLPPERLVAKAKRERDKLRRVYQPLNQQLYLLLEYYGYSFPEFMYD